MQIQSSRRPLALRPPRSDPARHNAIHQRSELTAAGHKPLGMRSPFAVVSLVELLQRLHSRRARCDLPLPCPRSRTWQPTAPMPCRSRGLPGRLKFEFFAGCFSILVGLGLGLCRFCLGTCFSPQAMAFWSATPRKMAVEGFYFKCLLFFGAESPRRHHQSFDQKGLRPDAAKRDKSFLARAEGPTISNMF